jgi:hypothetical protein
MATRGVALLRFYDTGVYACFSGMLPVSSPLKEARGNPSRGAVEVAMVVATTS